MTSALKADFGRDVRLDLPNMVAIDDTVQNVLKNIRAIRGRGQGQVAPHVESTTPRASEHPPTPLKVKRTLSKLSTIVESARQRVHDWKIQGHDFFREHYNTTNNNQPDVLVRHRSTACDRVRTESYATTQRDTFALQRTNANNTRTHDLTVKHPTLCSTQLHDRLHDDPSATTQGENCVRKQSNLPNTQVDDRVRKINAATQGGHCIRLPSNSCVSGAYDHVHNKSSATTEGDNCVRQRLAASKTLALDRISQRLTERVPHYQSRVTQGDNGIPLRSTAINTRGHDIIAQRSPVRVTQAHDHINKPSFATKQGDNCVRQHSTAAKTLGQDRISQPSTGRVTQTHDHVGKITQGDNSAPRRSTAANTRANDIIGQRSPTRVTQSHNRINKPSCLPTQGDNCVRQLSTATKTLGQDRIAQRTTAHVTQTLERVGKTTQGDNSAPPRSTATNTRASNIIGQRSPVRVTQSHNRINTPCYAPTQKSNSAPQRSTETKIPGQVRIGQQSTVGVAQAHDRAHKHACTTAPGVNCVRERVNATKVQGSNFISQRSTARVTQAHDRVGKSSYATTQGDMGVPRRATPSYTRGHDLVGRRSNVNNAQGDNLLRRNTTVRQPPRSDLNGPVRSKAIQENHLSRNNLAQSKIEGKNLGSQLLRQSRNQVVGLKHKQTIESKSKGLELTQNHNIDEETRANDLCSPPSLEFSESAFDLQQTDRPKSRGHDVGKLILESAEAICSDDFDGQSGHATHPNVIESKDAMPKLQKEDLSKGGDDMTCSTDATELTIVPDHLKNIITCKALEQFNHHNTDSPHNLKSSAMDQLMQMAQRGTAKFENVVCGSDKSQHLKTAEGIPPEIIMSAKPKVKEFLTSRINFARKIITKQHGPNAPTNNEVKAEDDTFKFNRMIRPKRILVEDNTQCELISGLIGDIDDLDGLVVDSELVGSGRIVENCGNESPVRERWLKLPQRLSKPDQASKSGQCNASKSVGSSRCKSHITAPTLGKKEREVAWFSRSLVRNASHMDDQSLEDDDDLNFQYICQSPTASTVSSVDEETLDDETNDMPLLTFESATHCTERTDKNDDQSRPVRGKLQTIKEQSHASNGSDRSSKCLSVQEQGSTNQSLLSSSIDVTGQGDRTSRSHFGHVESVHQESPSVSASVLQGHHIPTNLVFPGDMAGAHSVRSHRSRFSRMSRSIMHIDSDTLGSYDAMTDNFSTSADVDDVCFARDLLEELTEARDASVGKFVDEVYSHLDNVKHRLHCAQSKRRWEPPGHARGGTEDSLSTMSRTRKSHLDVQKKNKLCLPPGLACGQ